MTMQPNAAAIDHNPLCAAECSQSSNIVSCNFGTLAAGTNRVVTIAASAATAGTYVNTATANATNDSTPSDNAANFTVTVAAGNTCATFTCAPGSQLKPDAANITNPNQQACCDPLPEPVANDADVRCAARLPACACCAVCPRAAALSPSPSLLHSADAILCCCCTQNSITKTVNPDTVLAVSTTYSYVVEVTSLGPNAAVNTTVVDTLPAGLSVLSVSPGAPACMTSGQTVSCSFGLVPTGETRVVTITARAAQPGSYENTAVANADNDVDISNNEDRVTSVVFTPTCGVAYSNASSFLCERQRCCRCRMRVRVSGRA